MCSLDVPKQGCDAGEGGHGGYLPQMQGNLYEILPQQKYLCAYGAEYSETFRPHALGKIIKAAMCTGFFLYKPGAPMIEWAHKTYYEDTCYEMRQ